jgi:two-component system NtrC family sensor kinase
MIRNLSFRYKIPLRSSLLIAITAISVSASLMYGGYYDLEDDALQNADRTSRILVYSLKPLLLNDDVWRSYETINSPMQSTGGKKANYIDEILILNPRQQVYVSTNPKQFPVRSEFALINPKLNQLSSVISASLVDTPKSVEIAEAGKSYMVTPIISDGVLLGTLVIGYSNSMFLPHFYDIAWRSIVTTLIVSAVLLPLSWFWGWRMSIPLTQLSDSMARVGAETPLPDPDEFDLYESRDEVGQMGNALKRMVSDLKNKENLEKQMLFSERLAAVGRLTAGIAHEINNPLGGMLNTINTAKKHGTSDPQMQKTISLLERGLLQIKVIIGALLVEAKFQNHPLTVQDIEDTRTLVLTNVRNKSTELIWENDILETLPLPSTMVRQVLINLLLNAIQASDAYVNCHVYGDSTNLFMVVKNDGKHIDSEQMGYLFEPFATWREDGLGLGLWMTYQIISQLNGLITMQSQPGETIFTVTLPLGAQI